MKFRSLTLLAVILCAFTAQAQTADEIIAKYFETMGGLDKLKTVQGVKMSAKINNQGMELPLTVIQLKDGRQFQSINLQGKELKQQVFDGTTLWSTNFANMLPEKSDAESTENFITNLGSDFPIPFVGYKDRGYKVELLGKETIEGTETFKIKLTKKPIKVDGQPKESIEYYFFDAENYAVIMVEQEISTGPAKGMVSQVKLSDYQDVNGLLFPFSLSQGVKGQGSSAPITFTTIELNPKVDDAAFAFVGGK